MTQNTDTLEKNIYMLLKKIGANPAIKGYNYAKTGLMLMFEDKTCFNSITKVFYPTIAEIHGTTSTRVERAIRSLVMSIFNNNENEEIIREIFSTTTAVTNSKFFAYTFEYLTYNTIT